ncbi:MAG TPA: DUF1003 domain-containing protein [bacterium]|nr:DUF1003 domain-containing protein [bacterium]HPS30325.1 DUF1003 domain-containing protein [bacterium]
MKKTKICTVCGKSFSQNELISGHGIRHQIEKLILVDHPDWTDHDMICKADFEKYRVEYIKAVVAEEKGDLKALEEAVVKSINEDELISANINTSYGEKLKIGDRISDKVASFGGSWSFIIIFFLVLLFWIVLNSAWLFASSFDPFPFILLNLVLSCIAAIQAPVIMMSQNRQEKKDRIRAENDYKINLKSELEIRTLHEKMDHLLLIQWSKLMEIQELQIEILEDIKKEIEKKKP